MLTILICECNNGEIEHVEPRLRINQEIIENNIFDYYNKGRKEEWKLKKIIDIIETTNFTNPRDFKKYIDVLMLKYKKEV